jgi:hypothetical protein
MGNARVKFGQVLRTALISDGRVAMSATNLWVQRVTVLGKKTLSGTVNAGSINLGPSSAASEQPYVVVSNDVITIEAAAGVEFNLADWYFIVASDGDGIVVIYY